MEIIPTVFSKNKNDFLSRFEKLRKVSRELQIDFMDGKFVRSKSISVRDVPNLFQYNNIVEAHLMCKNPGKYIDELRKKGFGRIIFHYEAINNDEEAIALLKNIRRHGIHAVIAINPRTYPKKLEGLIPHLHHILIMGVSPGREKQKLLKSAFTKIRYLKKYHPEIKIQIDGGVNKQTAPKLFKAGANILNSGSFVADSKNPEKAIEELKK